MKPIVIIPSRLASIRLPGKALKEIHGAPMVEHVLRRGIEANLGPVVVAAGDDEIVRAVTKAGRYAVLTDPTLPSGSDRCHAALEAVDPNGNFDTIVVLQGDLPTIDPCAIRAAVTPLEADSACDIATLVTKIESAEELSSPQVVKVALSIKSGTTIGRALYFSRQVIPGGEGPHYHHVGLYAYRRQALQRFISLPRGILEQREQLEQLRALEAGMRIDASLIATEPLGVDTAEDLERAKYLLRPGTRLHAPAIDG